MLKRFMTMECCLKQLKFKEYMHIKKSSDGLYILVYAIIILWPAENKVQYCEESNDTVSYKSMLPLKTVNGVIINRDPSQ